MLWVFPKPFCILFSDTKGIQWVNTDATTESPLYFQSIPFQPVYCPGFTIEITSILSLGPFESILVD
jgi:hypothetical protein